MLKTKQTGRNKCFDKRDRRLVELGFGTYQNYLNSPVWFKIRDTVLVKRENQCFFCQGRATEVHHLRYTKNVLLAVNKYYLSGLCATCRGCHQLISNYAKSHQIGEQEALDRFCHYRKNNYDFGRFFMAGNSQHRPASRATVGSL